MRVLVADSLSRVRYALAVLLRQRPGLELVGEASDSEDLLAKAGASGPDVVLLDWKLRGLPAEDRLRALRQCCPGVHVIVLSDRPELRRDVLQAGADAFVSKVDPPDRLVAAIESARRRAQASDREDHQGEELQSLAGSAPIVPESDR